MPGLNVQMVGVSLTMIYYGRDSKVDLTFPFQATCTRSEIAEGLLKRAGAMSAVPQLVARVMP